MFGLRQTSYIQKTQTMEQDVKTSTFISLRSRLHASAQRLLANADDVNDALQELFVRVWQNKGIADTEGQRQAFMHITLRNICVDMLRRRRHFEDIDTSAEAQAATSNAASRIDAADSVADLRIRIRQCMSGTILRVFEMYAFNEMDYTEISSEFAQLCRGILTTSFSFSSHLVHQYSVSTTEFRRAQYLHRN